jgi:Rieske 2Fe-2S protein
MSASDNDGCSSSKAPTAQCLARHRSAAQNDGTPTMPSRDGYFERDSTAGDYITTIVGRQPIIVCRNKEGEIRAFYNTCRQRAAQVVPGSLIARANHPMLAYKATITASRVLEAAATLHV